MPKLGEIRKAEDAGYKGRAILIWDACPDCGSTRWRPRRLAGALCWSCAALRNARSKVPVTFDGDGSPSIGDVATARSLGYTGRGVMYFVACPSCGKGRWVRPKEKESRRSCVHCVLKGSHRPVVNRKVKRGYVMVRIVASDPMFSMADRNGWVLEHRLVGARVLGRPLDSGEVVHHINGVKDDNRECNLQVLVERDHNSHLVTRDLQRRVVELEKRVLYLEAENTALRRQTAGDMLILSQAEEQSSGVCRDFMGDTLEKGEEKVHSSRKLGGSSA